MNTQTRTSLSEQLAAFFLALDMDRLPPELVSKTKMLITDLAGVALGGSLQREVAPIHRVFARQGGVPESTVWNYGDKLPALSAAMINACYAHTLEMDDTHRSTYFHVGAVLIPPVLALAETLPVTGGRFIEAVAAGYEIALRIAIAVSPEHRLHGYHTTATVGVFGSAMACSMILGLNTAQTVNALGLAGTQSAGLFQFVHDGCSAKRFHAGRAAQSGIVAALLAREGFTGSPEILEGGFGFGKVMSPRFDPAQVTDKLGLHWHIMEMGIKPYSACRYCHGPIDAARRLRAHPDWSADKLESLELVCGKQLYDQTGSASPASIMGAQLSTPNAMALALLRGSNSPATVERHFLDPDVTALAQRIIMTVDPAIPVPGRQVQLKAKLHGAESFVISVPLPTGEPEYPMPEKDFYGKFDELASLALDKNTVRHLKDYIADLEHAADVSGLASLLVNRR